MTMTLTERNAYLSQYAAGIYDPATLAGKTLLLPPINNPSSGFYAAAYQDDVTGKVIVVFRGVEPTQGGDLSAAWALKTGTWHPQFDEAIDFMAKVASEKGWSVDQLNTEVLVTGHSLGGAMSQLVARLFGLDGAAFDPAGAYRQTLLPEFAAAAERLGIDVNANQISDSFRNYPVDDSLVPLETGAHIGQSRMLPPFATPGIADVFKGVLLGWATSNPIMAVLTIAVIDQFGYRHPSGNIQAAMTRIAQLEGDITLNPNGGETVITQTEDGVYIVRNGDGQQVGSISFQDGKLYLDAATGERFVITEQGVESFAGVQDIGFQTLINSVENYGPTLIDALSLIRAIQTGEPLPVVASGLRLANDLTTLNGASNLNLSGAANVASGVLSLMSLDAALERGDTLGAVTAGAQAISFGAQAFSDFAASQAFTAISEGGMDLAAEAAALQTQAIANTVGKALPYLNLANSISQGDYVGAGISTLQIANAAGWMAVPGINVIAIAYTVFNLVSSLFGDEEDIPDPWGTGSFTWNGTGISYQSAGETSGSEAVASVMGSVLATMNALIERERSQNPGSQLGIIPNRMPSVGYDMSGYRYTDIDPLSGAEKHPSLRFDTSGKPYNATPGSPEAFMSLGEAMIRSAIARGAIAPGWEVQTAKAQTDAGDPKAGLTEEERAGRDGQLAAPVTGSTQTFRPVVLDMDGDGIETVNKTASRMAFDVDDSGFMKQTGWIKGDDAFLVLDRNYNGQFDSGRELFSNGTVDLTRRGLAGMAWVDANYDGKLTAADPVWNELKVWQDEGDGVDEAGEKQTLAALGITELNYSMGTFTRNGQIRQLASPDMEADRDGTRINVVPEGIIVETSGGDISLLVTRIDDLTAVQANRDGVTGYEDVETIISGADLLANDTVGGFPGRDLTLIGHTGFLDANGFVHFIPEANDSGTRRNETAKDAANDLLWTMAA